MCAPREPSGCGFRHTTMHSTRSPRSSRPHRALLVGSVTAVAVLLTVAGCSGGNSDGSASTGSAGGGGTAARDMAPADPSAAGKASPAKQVSSPDSGSSDPVLVGRSLIKTGAVSLRSDDVSSVVGRIDTLVAREGGYIVSEDTSTDSHGVAVQSRLQVAVPSPDFDSALEEVASFGREVSKSSSSRDVTAQVVDVDSRVKSAQESIAQLRLLFSRATKLGDVIALENELSQREADLEALQSQQRDLHAHTTMATISVDVSSTATTAPGGHRAGGFLAGIRQGWHGLVEFVVAFSHGVGLVLPLATLALVAGLLTWMGVRRFTPRRRPRLSE
jgi:uncharacterized protein DUF4349